MQAAKINQVIDKFGARLEHVEVAVKNTKQGKKVPVREGSRARPTRPVVSILTFRSSVRNQVPLNHPLWQSSHLRRRK